MIGHSVFFGVKLSNANVGILEPSIIKIWMAYISIGILNSLLELDPHWILILNVLVI